ncbi:MAG: hypothetical protein DUD35_05460 [Lactobacillus sp.]|nr:MAG: hypothetical protein DUD35_05460 [Lactobacillus sp.]
MKDHKEVSSDATGYFSVYDVRQSRLFIDGNLIQGFAPDRPMFGIKDNKLLISQPVLKSKNWNWIFSGRHFDIVSPIDDANEIRLHGEYDSKTCGTINDILFDGGVPAVTLLFKIYGRYAGDIEPISSQFYDGVNFSQPTKTIHSLKGGTVSHDKHYRI